MQVAQGSLIPGWILFKQPLGTMYAIGLLTAATMLPLMYLSRAILAH
ncbi:hypothetical protein KR51_00015070 [Rubidibacter lacunae KORDI 51-2]|uniref:Uncharacterized protein n=1 Tax=Rubidibacter lacunae KORDI 51-2 TaxID=582515 RepID=U5DBC3_9CHRO|nr:hypothetical protein KR51_00015070 [Rubidibacter lacunae KORDI 51-2]